VRRARPKHANLQPDTLKHYRREWDSTAAPT
jgi:hypothetical protein